MNIKQIRASGADQLLLPVVESLHIERNPGILSMCGVKAELFEGYDFGFNQISTFSTLCLVPLKLDNGWNHIWGEDAQDRLLAVKNDSGRDSMPLCIWGIDAFGAYHSEYGKTFVLPERPNPKKKLIIFTQGKYKVGTGEKPTEIFQIYLKEKASGNGFEIGALADNASLLLYSSPGWDAVALCAEKSRCSIRTIET